MGINIYMELRRFCFVSATVDYITSSGYLLTAHHCVERTVFWEILLGWKIMQMVCCFFLVFQISAEPGSDEVFVEVKSFMDSKQWWLVTSHFTALSSWLFFFLYCTVGISCCCHTGCHCTTKLIFIISWEGKFLEGVWSWWQVTSKEAFMDLVKMKWRG